MKVAELRELDLEQLMNKEKDFREEEFNLRCRHATGQLDKTARLKQLRKEIARVKTVVREMEASS